VSTIAVDGLRRCEKCQTLYKTPASSDRSFCPADGQQHARGDFNYQLTFGINERNTQSNWRRCTRCQAIFFNGYGQGKCASDPAAQAPHTADVTKDFRVPHSRQGTDHVQTDWEFCTKCNVLFYSRSKTLNANHCTAGGEHEASPAASRFALIHDRPLPVLIDHGPELNPI
jgi:hypothetical protein